MKTRRIHKKKTRRVRKYKQKGGGEWCYGKGKTWSCSTTCGENGACEKLD